MKVVVFLIFAVFIKSQAQVNYIPAHILIPTYNVSNIGWNYPTINNTNLINPDLHSNQTIPKWNKTHPNWNNLAPKWNKTSLNNTNRWVYNYTTPSGDVIAGQVGYMDRLLYSQIYFKSRRWWSGREKTIEYPNDLPDKHYRHEIISAIRIYNKFYDGLDSKAEIVSGGVGHRYVKIRMSSSWGKGFKYLVQIFGH